MRDFYLICPIGLRSLMLEELNYKYSKYFDTSFKIISKDIGGIQIQCPLEQGLKLNRILKVPTRILLRIHQQKCRDLPKLYKILKKINWKEFLLQTNIEFIITARKSRLIHTERIKQSAQKALTDYFNANKFKSSLQRTNLPAQRIYLRLDADELTISLDTSGAEHYKRKQKLEYTSSASLRETYAAALLIKLLGLRPLKTRLIDPMCGSGTFLLEAISFFELNQQAAAYQNWNLPTYAPLTKNLEPIWNFTAIEGHDLHLTEPTRVHKKIDFSPGNYFDLKEIPDSTLIMNPPYGKRIKISGEPAEYFQSLITYAKETIKAHRLGIIIPLNISQKIRCSNRLKFNQNGVMVEFLVFNFKQ
ncbi:MAG: hypothetical protein QF441_12365 [Bacteriovoracaceae bacterium]|jgi:23S rRNA G2445 N2-methylase RlmL|nr:hypothetical protein [Halobacteriovoraceae bacterium]MDP7321399.1 hypothetical protein [Bacteriovoracaceae bacterium]|tara:strand:+ start:85 stop:1167 length:1083 start_codon:yes stop_codon:yes gene_type:complete